MFAAILGHICDAAIQNVYDDLNRRLTPNIISKAGGLISKVGLPEIGIPVGLAGHLVTYLANTAEAQPT